MANGRRGSSAGQSSRAFGETARQKLTQSGRATLAGRYRGINSLVG
jgi:hypothetical protein